WRSTNEGTCCRAGSSEPEGDAVQQLARWNRFHQDVRTTRRQTARARIKVIMSGERNDRLASRREQRRNERETVAIREREIDERERGHVNRCEVDRFRDRGRD